MAITDIQRDWGNNPSIVRVVTTDNIGVISTAGYLATQDQSIQDINHGDFQWVATDYVLIAYNGGIDFFRFDPVNNTFTPQGVVTSQILVTSAQIKGMSATPVLMIPNPGINKKIILISSVFNFNFIAPQYTAGGAIGLEFGNTALLAGPAASTTLAAATFNAYAASNTFELTPNNTNTAANIANKGVYLSNATAPFATGNGTLLADLSYQIVNAA